MKLFDWIFRRAKPDDDGLGLDQLATKAKNLSPKDILEHLAEVRAKWEGCHVRLGFIGETGSGKSSLINAIVGAKVAEESPVPANHSPEGEEHRHNNIILVDLPGCGAPDRRRETYIEDLKLLQRGKYDGFILVCEKLNQDDVWLFEMLHKKANTPFFLVRTKFDSAVKARQDEAQARQEIESYFRQHLKGASDSVIYMVSAHHPQLYDLPKLLQDLCDSLPRLKRGRLLAAIPAYTEKLLEQKREVADKIVLLYAALAAGNGINPIPGLNVAVDLGLVQVMTNQVIDCYGLHREQLEDLSRLGISDATLDVMLQAASPVLARLVQEGSGRSLAAGRWTGRTGGRSCSSGANGESGRQGRRQATGKTGREGSRRAGRQATGQTGRSTGGQASGRRILEIRSEVCSDRRPTGRGRCRFRDDVLLRTAAVG